MKRKTICVGTATFIASMAATMTSFGGQGPQNNAASTNVESFLGYWEGADRRDNSEIRTQMEISKNSDNSLRIEIEGSSGAFSGVIYTLSGNYDSAKGGLVCSGTRNQYEFLPDGSEENTIVSVNEFLYIGTDGRLYFDERIDSSFASECYRRPMVGGETAYGLDTKLIIPENTEDPGSYLCSWSDSAYITEQDMRLLDYGVARVVLNEIYARHGRLFKDQALQELFNEKTWYYGYIKPEDFNDGTMLNEIEKTNVQTIKKYMEKIK